MSYLCGFINWLNGVNGQVWAAWVQALGAIGIIGYMAWQARSDTNKTIKRNNKVLMIYTIEIVGALQRAVTAAETQQAVEFKNIALRMRNAETNYEKITLQLLPEEVIIHLMSVREAAEWVREESERFAAQQISQSNIKPFQDKLKIVEETMIAMRKAIGKDGDEE